MSVVFRMINSTHGTLKVVQQVGNSVSFRVMGVVEDLNTADGEALNKNC